MLEILDSIFVVVDMFIKLEEEYPGYYAALIHDIDRMLRSHEMEGDEYGKFEGYNA